MYKLQTECPICQKSTNSSGFISHLGQVHLQVEKYLPDYAKIPASVKGRSGQRYTRNRRHKNRKKVQDDQEEVWPEPPEGFNPATREFLEVPLQSAPIF